jgi:LPXTG-site transpeptidase (sortase) family protein
MKRRQYGWRFWLLLLPIFLPVIPARADTGAGSPIFFSETGHTLAYGFRAFFDRNGGLAIFGYPLTEVFIEDGRPVQYFERARLEWHADLGIVQAGHLGRWAATQSTVQAMEPVPAVEPPDPEIDYFHATAHTLRGAFRHYWHTAGGLAVFGYPLSEPFVERNDEDGRDYEVQYFERARFEYHPDLPPAYQVLLGHLGRRWLAEHEPPAGTREPVANAEAAWAGLRPTRVTIQRIGVDAPVTEAGFSLGEWDVPRYTAAHYWPVAAFPGTRGNTIIAAHAGYKDTLFYHLPKVEAGDEIVVSVGDRPYRYVVREVLTLLPTDTWVMLPTSTETLTLITCVPLRVYSHRLVVRAELLPS